MPAHDRLCWRLNSLVGSQAGRLFRQHQQHEPLLFLYPRWLATTTAAGTTAAANTDRDTPTTTNPMPMSPEDGGSAMAGERTADADPDPDPDSRPSANLVKTLLVKAKYREKKERKRLEYATERHTDEKDWRTAFAMLCRHTPRGSKKYLRRFQQWNMPRGMRGYHEGSLHELFLDIYFTTTCQVQVSRDTMDEDGTFLALDMLGTPQAIRQAKERLKDSLKVKYEDDLSATETESMNTYKTRTTPILNRVPRSVYFQEPQEAFPTRRSWNIEPPKSWTLASFANHIHDLTRLRIPRGPGSVARKTVAGRVTSEQASTEAEGETSIEERENYISMLAAKLYNLLIDPAMLPCMSSYACDTAFEFLVFHRRLPEVRRIIELLNNQGYIFNTHSFNICLRGSRDAGDVHSFSFLLRFMLERKVEPDWETWATFVGLVAQRDMRAAREITRAMRQRGLLAVPQAKTAVAAVLVQADFTDWVDRGGGTSGFIEHYDASMGGPEWLDNPSANRMLSVRAQRGQFSDAFAILDTLKERGRRPTIASLNTLLSAAAQQDNTLAIVQSLDKILNEWHRIKPDQITMKALFHAAWHGKRYNLLRVVWQYACAYGVVPYRMQRAFEDTVWRWCLPLPSDLDAQIENLLMLPSAPSRNEVFRSIAPKLALGIACSDPEGDTPTTGSSPRNSEIETILPFALQVPGNAEADVIRLRQRRVELTKLLKQDMDQVAKLQPVSNLPEMVATAVAMDAAWKKLGLAKTPDVKYMFENIIRVPMRASETGPKIADKSTDDKSIDGNSVGDKPVDDLGLS